MGILSFFDDKVERRVTVNGAISPIREDSLIKNSTGIVIAGAVLANEDITEALVLNAATGTVSSYHSFNRKVKNSNLIGLPTIYATYSDISKEAVAAGIRADINQVYPTINDIVDSDIIKNALTGTQHLKAYLQDTYDYNLTTNILSYSGVSYFYSTYTDIYAGPSHTGYNVTITRDKITTTTTSSVFTVYYGTSPSDVSNKWRVKEDITTRVTVEYNPADTTSLTVTNESVYSLYDLVEDPWSLSLCDPSVGVCTPTELLPVTVCAIPTWSSLCSPVVVTTTIAESITFVVNEARPSPTIEVLDQYGNPQTQPNEYWVIYYTYSGRKYIWVKKFTGNTLFEEITSDTSGNPYLAFSPIVPIRNNKNNLTSSSNPALYTQVSACLKLIGLNIEDINSQITEPDIEDVYVSMFSPLNSDHQDQLAYNYAFFDYMYDISTITVLNADNTILTNTNIFNYNKLKVYFTSIYSNEIAWGPIVKTTGKIGVLANEYEFSLSSTTRNHWLLDIELISYTIRKRTSANTYDQLEITNFSMEYIVYSSGNEINVFTVGYDAADEKQLVIPVSFEIAKDFMPRKYLETFYLRSTCVGMFAKNVQEIRTKWYQQGWFRIVITIAAIAIAAYTGYLQPAIAEFTATVTAAFEAGAIAVFTLVAKYAIIQYVTKFVLTQIFKGTDNPVLRVLATAAVVYVTIQMGDFKTDFSKILAGSTIAVDSLNLATNIDLQDIQLKLQTEWEQFSTLDAKFREFNKQFEVAEAARVNGDRFLELYNLFANSSDILTETEIYSIVSNPNYLIDTTNNFAESAVKLASISEIMYKAEQLLNT